MKALRNVLHGGVLALWALMGLSLTLRGLFGNGPFWPGVLSAGSYWLWFAGLAALSTWLVARSERAWSALLVHAGLVLTLSALPQVLPFSLFRLGLDLLGHS